MLQAQVNYWSLIENRRHNIATEEQARNELAETKRSHQANETLGWANLNEVIRHNQTQEQETHRYNTLYLNEYSRHNKEAERLQLYNVAEIERHNIANENISYKQLSQEAQRIAIQRGNLAVAQANANTNRLNASIAGYRAATDKALGLKNASIASRNADTNRLNAVTRTYEASIQEGKLQVDQYNAIMKSVQGFSQMVIK